ncbi:MAG: hypothetical protein RL748_46 [Pseudomonadota bacterium]
MTVGTPFTVPLTLSTPGKLNCGTVLLASGKIWCALAFDIKLLPGDLAQIGLAEIEFMVADSGGIVLQRIHGFVSRQGRCTIWQARRGLRLEATFANGNAADQQNKLPQQALAFAFNLRRHQAQLLVADGVIQRQGDPVPGFGGA